MSYNFRVLNLSSGGSNYSVQAYSSLDGSTWTHQSLINQQAVKPSHDDLFKTNIGLSIDNGNTGLLVLDGVAADALPKAPAKLIQKRREAFEKAKAAESRDLGCFFAVDAFSKPMRVTAPTGGTGSMAFVNNFKVYDSAKLSNETKFSIGDKDNIDVVMRQEGRTPSTEAILSHIVKMIQLPIDDDFHFGERRPGIHEADLTTETLRRAFTDIDRFLSTRGEASAIEWVKFVAHDNEGYFDYLFGPGSNHYEETAAEIKINQAIEFEASSLPYVEDLLQMNSALQEVIEFCSKSEIQGIKDQTPRFTTMYEGLIGFTNKVLEHTKIPTDNLQNALVKFLGVESWAKFQEKYPGLLVN